MTRIAFLLTFIVIALASMPAQAQRVFVSGTGLDTNPCTVTEPCRTFQHAHDTVAANGEIDVLDPAGYGPLTITKGISIQAHGFGGITQTTSCIACAAITISVTTLDPVTLNGLLLDGAGTGGTGIYITSGSSVQILNSVVRHFHDGIFDSTTTNGSNLLIQDTIASDNPNSGILVVPNGGSVQATLNRITANNNTFGVGTTGTHLTTITNSVMSNNSNGLQSNGGVTWLAKTVISGNARGVNLAGGPVNSYGDNYINDHTTPVVGGSLTPVGMQ
jgi:Right handed beta helix region